MINAIFILKSLQPYLVNTPLNERAKVAAKIIHTYRRAGQFPSTDNILNYLSLCDDDVGPVYKELYGRPLHLNRVPPLEEHERYLYLSSSGAGLTDAQLYYLHSKGIVDLRINNGMLFVHRDNWNQYRNRTNGYLSLIETAEFLGVSKSYVRKLLGLGLLSSRPPGTHEYGNMHLIQFSEAETVKPRLEWVSLSEAARRHNITREDTSQILKAHTLSAHKDKRKRKRTKTHWRRIRIGNQVLVRSIDFELYFEN